MSVARSYNNCPTLHAYEKMEYLDVLNSSITVQDEPLTTVYYKLWLYHMYVSQAKPTYSFS